MDDLRPIERVIVKLGDDGLAAAEIASKLGKKPGTVDRILKMVEMRDGASYDPESDVLDLRPLERVVLKLREKGESYGEIGNRLGRSGPQIRRIEGYAQLKLSI